jgi:hypothetical protein
MGSSANAVNYYDQSRASAPKAVSLADFLRKQESVAGTGICTRHELNGDEAAHSAQSKFNFDRIRNFALNDEAKSSPVWAL